VISYVITHKIISFLYSLQEENFILKFPCPGSVNLLQKGIKQALISLFSHNCFSPVNVKIMDVKRLTSINEPCGYELSCFCKFDPEDKLIKENEGNILGREELIRHVIEDHKTTFKINIKMYCIKFYNEQNFRVSIYLVR
jgi:hypothetical protein